MKIGLVLFLLALALPIAAQNPSSASPAAPDKNTKAPAGFNPGSTDQISDLFNGRPIPPNAYRVLFVGDSLTLHPPAQGKWAYYSGMAASDAAHDFVHLTAAHIQARMTSRPVEIFYCHANGKIPAILEYLQAHPELKPDLVILQGGENDPFDDAYPKAYRELVDFYLHISRIVLSDWADPEKRDFERKEVVQRHLPFIDLTAIRAESGTSGNGGPFRHPGVAWHPNDRGMERIAEEIDKLLASGILPR